MAHGGPDWGTGGLISTVFTIEDLGELAARLKSAVTFDRRGNIIILDDFNDGLAKCWTGGSGDGNKVEWTAEASRSGGYSAKLTTGDADHNDARIGHRTPFSVLSKFGHEFSFAIVENIKQLLVFLDLYDGTKVWQPQFVWYKTTGIVVLRIAGGAWPELSPPIPLISDPLVFNTMKLVVDFAEKQYVRLIANNTVFDLSSYSLDSTGVIHDPYFSSGIYAYGDGVGNGIMYVDDIIITQNEP